MAEIHLKIPEDILQGVPEHVRTILDAYPFVIGGESDEELRTLSEGRCLVCGNTFGTETAVIVGNEGILYLMDNPICFDSHIIAAFLMEQVKDIHEQVQFRGEDHGQQG